MTISNKELQESLSAIKSDDDIPANSSIVYFNENGLECSKTYKNICARQIEKDGKKFFQIKVGRNQKPFDPTDQNVNKKLNSKDQLTKGKLYNFQSVKGSCFDLYIRFLKNRQDSLLQATRRELS